GRIRQIRCAASATTRRCGSATYDNVRTRDLLGARFFLQLPRITRPIANRLVNETKAGRGD
ncbi:MAG TPA: hypothetical protein VKH62_04780, partial [Candidatus Binatia bacterium]|nr:hypothetical protein [Candidatus Binatia bacterium]